MSATDSVENTERDVLSRSKLLAAAGEFDLESIQFLSLPDCGINDISALEPCSNLIRLDLRNNEVSILRPIRKLKSLAFLNLSGNRITNIDALSGLESLSDLDLSGNLIGRFERLQCLQNLENLEKLRFCNTVKKLSNPICHNLSYEEQIKGMFPNLLVLDGMRLKGYGSELYKACKDLDEQIKHERTFGPVGEHPLPGAWLRPGYFSLPTHSEKEDYATTEFKETLDKCKKLNEAAKDHIEAVKK